MTAHARELAQRRERLLLRSTELRIELARQTGVLDGPLALADRAVAAVRWLRANPLYPAAGGVALLLLRPRRALRWATRAWWAWGLYQRAQRSGRAIVSGRPRR